MPATERYGSSIAQFSSSDSGRWPGERAIGALVRECARLLFEECQADYCTWLSEADLQCLFYVVLRRELLAGGIPACAAHAAYPFKIPLLQSEKLGRRDRTLPVDVILVVPDTVHIVRGRRWTGDVEAAIEIKRGFERKREIRGDLANLAAIHEAWPQIEPYMLIMGYHSDPEDIAAVERAAAAAGVALLCDNYWGQHRAIDQLELDA